MLKLVILKREASEARASVRPLSSHSTSQKKPAPYGQREHQCYSAQPSHLRAYYYIIYYNLLLSINFLFRCTDTRKENKTSHEQLQRQARNESELIGLN